MNDRRIPALGNSNLRQMSWAAVLVIPLVLAACNGPAERYAKNVQDVPLETAPASAEGVPSHGSLFSLTSQWRDQTGGRMQFSDLAGKVAVITMVYTTCTATCPLVVAELQRVEHGLDSAERIHVRFVLVSLDPDRDQPERLAAWAASQKLDPSRWILLAGDDGSVRELAAVTDVRYQKQASGEIAHSNSFTVIGPDGRILAGEPGLGHAGRLLQAVKAGVLGAQTSLDSPFIEPLER